MPCVLANKYKLPLLTFDAFLLSAQCDVMTRVKRGVSTWKGYFDSQHEG